MNRRRARWGWPGLPRAVLAHGGYAMHAAEPGTIPAGQASAFARLALKGIAQRVPEQARPRPHRRGRREDAEGAAPGVLRVLRLALVGPRALDARRGCSSAVPDLPEAKEIRAVLAANLTAEEPEGRGRLLHAAGRASRSSGTYGWAWLLKLAEELHGWDDPDGKAWAANLQPLADADRRPLPRLPPEADVPDPHRGPPEHGVRAGVRPRLRADRGPQEAAGADRGAGEDVLRRRTRTPRRGGSRAARTSSRRV